jgi:hypothetical protein
MNKRWQLFRATPLGELITGSAHEAHPTDITAPLGVRFAGQSILALHVALDKAATVRVSFDGAGNARLTGIRNIRQRASAELTDVLRAEGAAIHTHWVVVVLATSWQAILGQRAARPDPTDRQSAFARHRLMFESPEVVVPRAQVDRVYTAVDHPVLDKSVVFSVRRREVEELLGEVRRCGLEVAAVRIGVAAQLEAWLAQEGEAGATRDLLISDGLSALLLNTDQGDFVLPHSAVEAEQPRQAVQRPSTIEEDITRFVTATPGRAVTFIGPEELCAAVKKHSGDVEIVRPVGHLAHDTQQVTLAALVQHDLNFEAREVRPAIHRKWRRALVVYGGLAAALIVVTAVNISYAVRAGYQAFALERQSAQRALELQADTAEIAQMAGELGEATALQSWISGNYHAQKFCYRLLRDIPASAALDRVVVEMKDGQLALTFVVLGDQEIQLAARRAIERAIADLHFKIGGEEQPIATAGSGRAIQYRLHIIVPDAAEVTSS